MEIHHSPSMRTNKRNDKGAKGNQLAGRLVIMKAKAKATESGWTIKPRLLERNR